MHYYLCSTVIYVYMCGIYKNKNFVIKLDLIFVLFFLKCAEKKLNGAFSSINQNTRNIICYTFNHIKFYKLGKRWLDVSVNFVLVLLMSLMIASHLFQVLIT